MDKRDKDALKIKIDTLEKLLSSKELRRISVSKRLNRIRKQLNTLIAYSN
jgi:hypothetical protein